jgi:hypothetical protein
MAIQPNWDVNNKNTFLGNVDPLAMGLGAILGGPLGMLFGGAVSGSFGMAGNAQKKAEGTVDKQITDLGSWYKKESGKSYLDTEAVQSALGQLRSSLAQTFQTQGNQLRSGGGTAEAALAGRTNAAENYSGTVNKLVGYQTDRKDQLARDYQYRMQNWQNAKLGLQQQQSQNWSNIGSQIASLPFNVIEGLAGLAPMLGL